MLSISFFLEYFIKSAQDFLKIADDFKLGDLDTEKFNPQTVGLSDLSKNSLDQAIDCFKNVDIDSLNLLKSNLHKLKTLHLDIKNILKNGGRVFISGCGATGRLALTLETYWRLKYKNTKYVDRIISFMAGGDLALIHSLESFEDHPEYGARQVQELGLRKEDLVIGVTEGGETPFVIGSVNAAKNICDRNPYILYCNRDDQLVKLKRCENFIHSSHINNISLPAGPMALAGSTRLQASTVLQMAVGLCLNYWEDSFEKIFSHMDNFIEKYKNSSLMDLKLFIEWESEVYKKNNFINYFSSSDLGIVLLTDTTERSPTFSLPTFENTQTESHSFSLSYLILEGEDDVEKSWSKLLKRNPRTLEWNELNQVASKSRLMGFDISNKMLKRRRLKLNQVEDVKIHIDEKFLSFSTCEFKLNIPCPFDHLFDQYLFLKLVMNLSSTLIMGRIGRFESNVMTFVKPSNNKLIDRAARYIDLLLKQKSISVEYEEIIEQIFILKEKLSVEESIVMECVDYFKTKKY